MSSGGSASTVASASSSEPNSSNMAAPHAGRSAAAGWAGSSAPGSSIAGWKSSTSRDSSPRACAAMVARLSAAVSGTASPARRAAAAAVSSRSSTSVSSARDAYRVAAASSSRPGRARSASGTAASQRSPVSCGKVARVDCHQRGRGAVEQADVARPDGDRAGAQRVAAVEQQVGGLARRRGHPVGGQQPAPARRSTVDARALSRRRDEAGDQRHPAGEQRPGRRARRPECVSVAASAEPSTARLSSASRSAAVSAETTSSQRKSRATPAGAARVSRTRAGQPPRPFTSATGRPASRAARSSSAAPNARSAWSSRRTWSGGVQSGQRYGRDAAAAQHQMRARRQAGDQVGDQAVAGGSGRQLVQVVEDQAGLDR